jgi:hypothetical protein
VTSRSEIETTPFEELCSQACAESKVLNPGCFDILKVPAIEKLYKVATLNNEIRELNQYRSTIDISGFAPEPVFFYQRQNGELRGRNCARHPGHSL